MSEVTIFARIPRDLDEELTALGQEVGRERSQMIEEALRRHIASERQFLAAVEEGLRELEAGDVVDDADVNEMMRERRARLITRGTDSSLRLE